MLHKWKEDSQEDRQNKLKIYAAHHLKTTYQATFMQICLYE
jgi:hypothetical protein